MSINVEFTRRLETTIGGNEWEFIEIMSIPDFVSTYEDVTLWAMK